MFKMYAEYEDGACLYFTEKSEDDCMCSIADTTERHGECTFYTGATDGEHYIDGEYYDYYDEDKKGYVTE